MNRDIFPLPLLRVEPPMVQRLSRGCTQRIHKRARLTDRVNDSLLALNILYTGPRGVSHSPHGFASVDALQQMVIHRVWQSHAENVPPLDLMRPEEALRALLRADAGYTDTASGLAPFHGPDVSLPPVGNLPCRVEEIVNSPVRYQLDNWQDEMLLSPEEYGGVMERIGEIGCYMDPPKRTCCFQCSVWRS